MKQRNISSKDIKTFKAQYLKDELRFPEPKWATSIKEAEHAQIPEHNMDYFEYCHLINTCKLDTVIPRLARYFQSDFVSSDLFTKNLNDRKLFRLYNLWTSGHKVTPPVIRLYPSKDQSYDLEIVEGNHRIKLCLMSNTSSIPILVDNNSFEGSDPQKNALFKKQLLNKK